MSSLVSIIVPAYNEGSRIVGTLKSLQAIFLHQGNVELIVVNDGSTDNTSALLSPFTTGCVVVTHPKNLGKGAAIRSGIARSQGSIIALYDADAEYEIDDLVALIKVVEEGRTRVAYGSRMIGRNPVGYWLYYIGNIVISAWTRILYGVSLTDVETGAKVFRREAYDAIALTQNRFGFEIELTARLLRAGYTIAELPIKYHPRRFSEGKKITWIDGVQALWLLFYYRFY